MGEEVIIATDVPKQNRTCKLQKGQHLHLFPGRTSPTAEAGEYYSTIACSKFFGAHSKGAKRRLSRLSIVEQICGGVPFGLIQKVLKDQGPTTPK